MNLSIPRKSRAAVVAIALSCALAPAQAGVIDLTDGVFVPGSVVYGVAGPIIEFAKQVDGVTFTFTASGEFREIGPWSTGTDPGSYYLEFGGANGNTPHFTITADARVELVSLLSVGYPYASILQPAVFDIFDGLGNVVSPGNVASSANTVLSRANAAVDPFVDGPILINPGEPITFLVTNSTPATATGVFEITFQPVPSTVPSAAVPALLLSGFGLLGVAARRRREGRR